MTKLRLQVAVMYEMIGRSVMAKILPCILLAASLWNGGCAEPSEAGRGLEVVEYLQHGLEARYGESLTVHCVDVILETSLELYPIGEIDSGGRSDSPWNSVNWEEVRLAIAEMLIRKGYDAGGDSRSGVACAIWEIRPPIRGNTSTSAWPIFVKGPETVWNRAVFVFHQKDLVGIVCTFSGE